MTKEEILRKVESDYQLGGLSSGLYADYALDVAEIYKDQETAALQEKYDKLKAAAEDFIAKVDSGRARSTDSYNKFKEALK